MPVVGAGRISRRSIRAYAQRLSRLLGLSLCGWIASCGTSQNYAPRPINPDGYRIEYLSIQITASFARGHDIYLSGADGEIFRADDREAVDSRVSLGRPIIGGAKLLFASSAGTVFAATFGGPVLRTDDGGQTWTLALDRPCWRMDEDDMGSLYVGNYPADGATVYKSDDQGRSWRVVFEDPINNHIHTVRWDDVAKRLYIAFGDARTRGQAMSDDRGASFSIVASGPDQGDTDVAVMPNCLLWCSDDQSGRVFRAARRGGPMQTLMSGTGFMFFGVGAGKQVYVGTVSSLPHGGDRAALLASSDEGATWQTLVESDVSTAPYSRVVGAESRNLSTEGWLYFTADTPTGTRSFRVRRVAE